MKKRTTIIFLVFLTLYSLIFSNQNTTLKPASNLISGKLENGLEYYILKNKKPENRASLNLIVKAGSLLETEEQQGLAHFLEHMAFNGTTKYEKNELVKYLQSLGLSFGGDLNAYTSFSETVYKLQVPTTKPDLEIGFEVLKEWASEITLDSKDIENEKKIIIEEWRLRQGITKRIGDLQKKILYSNSHYSNRFPIGFPETINNATAEKLKDYYTKWYQPENMALVAVGDFNEEEIKKLILKNFSAIPNKNKISKEEFPIPLVDKNSVTSFTDPELTSTNFNIMWKEAITPINSELSFEKALEKILLNSILNTRLSILSKEKNSPFVYSSMYNFSLNKQTSIFANSSLIKDTNLENVIKDVINNLKEISINGVPNTELEREKNNLLNNLKTVLNNKDSIKNDIYIDSIVDYITNDNIFLNPEKEFELTKQFLPKITSETLKSATENLLSLNYNVLITSRDNMKAILPTELEIQKLIDDLLVQKLSTIKLNESNIVLSEIKLSPGTSKIKNKNKEYTEISLSNGIDVLYKKTDFDKDNINFKLTKLQGSSSLDYPKYINSIFLPGILSNSGVGNVDYNSLELYFKGKNFSVSPYIKDYSQGFTINTNKENLEESLKYFRSLILEPKFDNNIIESTLKTNKELIQNRNFSPRSVFRKTYSETLNSKHPRRVPLNIDDLSNISKENLEETFDFLFTNFKDYKLTVTGSIDEESLELALNNFFANLPVTNVSTSVKPLGVVYPKGNIKKSVVQGIDKKSVVILTFPYKGNFTIENRALYNSFSNLLNILLIENVREKIGGVYSISSSANLEKLNFGENYLQITFSTDTTRVNEVISKAKSVVLDVQRGTFPENKILDIQKNYELNFETAVKTNNFWQNYLEKKNLISDYEFYTPMRYNDIVTYNSIVNFSNRVLNINHCVEVTLLPEKEE
ncbi:M16 family metallopeptidase [Cetobacterium sp.]|uniref:M16 family metallopeptidase n=1 Tax=Cetobacterium sp. TaxID=2071632 RepID=UPI003F3BC902